VACSAIRWCGSLSCAGGQDATCGCCEAWARKFFDNWRAQLKWRRLAPSERFADMIERRWGGLAAYCRSENKVPLGFVEGLNNKIRVLQRRAYGLRDEESLRLEVLTCMLPKR
jgi:transposase